MGTDLRQRNHDGTVEFPIPDGEEKLKNLILYIADKCAGDQHFGTIKLNKVLFFADFLAYGMTGKPITGVEYLALDAGPAPRRMPAIKAEMIEDRKIAEQVSTVPGGTDGYTEKRVIASEKANLDMFSGTEIAVVDAVIESVRKKTAKDVSFWSHGWAWRIGRKATGSIPYEAAFIANRRPTEFQIARGLELIEKYGWGK